MDEEQERADRLERWFAGRQRVAVALSGGVDSSLVAFAARRFLGRDAVVCLISASASLKTRDLMETRQFCGQFDIVLVEIQTQEMNDPQYLSNPVNRCFFCKTALYNEMEQQIAQRYPGYSILNGSNLGDFGDYRPGLKAAEEHHVFSPLADCGFYKDDVRQLARHWGLPNWNKPASPCLSSRFPYGEAIQPDKLAQVERAEDFLNTLGFEDVRVRYLAGGARIEVPAGQVSRLREQFGSVRSQLIADGFTTVEIDEEGLVSGKLNRVLSHADRSLMVRTATAAK